MADPLQFNAPFNLKNFLGSKGTSGLESIFNHVPDKMKISILQAMHKMHPVQAENFMVNIYNEWVSKLGSKDASGKVYHGKDFHSWIADKIKHRTVPGSAYDIGKPLSLEGPWAGGQDTGYTNIEKIPYDHVKKLRMQLADPNLDSKTRKLIESFLKMHTTDAGKYEMALLNQLEKEGANIVTNIVDDVELGKARVIDHTIPEGDVIDFKTRKIINPKINYPYPQYIPPWQRELQKPIPPGQQMTHIPAVPKGIPWSKIGMRLLNNPFTRFVGGVGNVALGGQALLDIGTGSQHTKNMMTDVNRFFRVPMDRQGNVIHSVPTYKNLQNVAQRDVLNPNEMRGVTSFDTTRYNPREMNSGGIVSLMV